MTPKLIDALGRLPKMCRHIHLPLQSGSDRTLVRMRRDYTVADYLTVVAALRDRLPGLALTTDIIVGFPGESEADYLETRRLLQRIEFDNIYAFKYSRRPRTAALSLEDQVSETEKDRRLQDVLAVQRPITRNKNLAYQDRIEDVLVEGLSKTNRSRLAGRTSTNRVVNFDGPVSWIGRTVSLRIARVQANSLEGSVP
jgi:tRNA-2-methylthio-N6-dimethylallyladenosine synthase